MVCAAALALAAVAAQAGRCPERLRIAFPDSPAEPFIRGPGPGFEQPRPGLLVDWTRAALKRLGCLEGAQMLRLPARRVRALIEVGEIDLVAGVARGGPVAALLALPPVQPDGSDLSLGRIDYVLYIRRGLLAREATAASGVSDLPPLGDPRVGVMAGGRAEALARERGWPVDLAPTHESSLQKLRAGRTPLLLVHQHFLEERLRREPELARQIERFGPVQESLRLQVGALPELARRQPDFVAALWRELCRQSAASGPRVPGACRLP